ncbi:MAG: hypothetical protein AAF449_01530 [Myxococcota bacterium]
MSPQAHHGFEDDVSSTALDATLDATLIDDPQHPRQQAMRALVEAEQARMAAEQAWAAEEAETGADDNTRLGMLVPDAITEPNPVPRAAPRALPVPVVHTPPPDEGSGRSNSGHWHVEWFEVEESMSTPMVRPVGEESLARAAAVPQVIRSSNPPPGPERSVVVQQVSPFGSDARVMKKTKNPIIPQGETLPFAIGDAPTAPPMSKQKAPMPSVQNEDWNATSAEIPGAPPSPGAKIVAMGGEVSPQRYIPTQLQPLPPRPQPAVRREFLPLTSALCAVVVAVAALVNVLI